MASLLVNINYSHQMTDIRIILPDYAVCKGNGMDPDKKLKVLWLLHDYGGDCNEWERNTQLEYMAKTMNIMIVCPSGRVNYFVDSAKFSSYETLMTDKLWNYVTHMFPASSRREDNYIAGCGMGGYGALYLAMKSGLYGTCWSLNGDLKAPERFMAGNPDKFRNPHVFEKDPVSYCLSTIAKEAKELPAITISCMNSAVDVSMELEAVLAERGIQVEKHLYADNDLWIYCNEELKQLLMRMVV